MLEHVIEGCQCEGKVCTKCPGVKCVGMFYSHKKNKDGLRYDCKKCACAAVKKYNQEHPEEQKERRKKRYWANPEQVRASVKEYYQEHTEERKAYSRDYRTTHPEQVQQYNQQYYQDNREQEIARALAYWYAHPEQKQKHLEWLEENAEAVQAYSARYAQEHAEEIAVYHNSPRYKVIRRAIANRRRTRVTQAGGTYTVDEWEALKAEYDYTCLCCGKCEPEVQLEADHVIPVSKNGSGDIDNIQPLCSPCNKRKGRKTTDYRPQYKSERRAG